MNRPQFTPRSWYNEDKTLQFYLSDNGSIDILPGPNAAIMRKIGSQLTATQRELLFPTKRSKAPDHIHWTEKIED